MKQNVMFLLKSALWGTLAAMVACLLIFIPQIMENEVVSAHGLGPAWMLALLLSFWIGLGVAVSIAIIMLVIKKPKIRMLTALTAVISSITIILLFFVIW